MSQSLDKLLKRTWNYYYYHYTVATLNKFKN